MPTTVLKKSECGEEVAEQYFFKRLLYTVAEVLPTSSGNANAGIKKGFAS